MKIWTFYDFLGGHPELAIDGHLKNRPTEEALRTLVPTGLGSVNVSNVLSDDKQKQVMALGQLGWTLRRIEKQTGIRRETAAAYLRANRGAGAPPDSGGRLPPPIQNRPTKPAR